MEKQYILRDGNFYQQTIQEECLGSQNKLFSRIANQAPISFPNIMAEKIEPVNLFGTLLDYGSRNVCLTKDPMHPNYYLLSIRVPFLPWVGDKRNTDFAPFRDPRREENVEHREVVKWVPPSNMMFVLHAEYNCSMRCLRKGYLTLTEKGDVGKTYCPPYPNLFREQSDLCLGDDMERYRSRDSVDSFLGHFFYDFVPTFLDSPMNTDLISDKTFDFFKFNHDDHTNYESEVEHLKGSWWSSIRLPKVHEENLLSAVEALDAEA